MFCNRFICFLAFLASIAFFGTISADAALPKLQLERVFSNLDIVRPLSLQETPDGSGRVYVVGQDGIISMVRKGSDGSDAKETFNIESRRPHIENEAGLLGMVFHPNFKQNHLVYLYYTQQNTNADRQFTSYPKRTITSEFKMSAKDPDLIDPSSERKLLQIERPFWNHEGGCLLFDKEGYLYITSGDGGSAGDPNNNGQTLTNLLAKIIRIDVDHKSPGLEYAIPSANPFVNRPGARPEIYAFGLRNAWRISIDQETGTFWAADVGQDKFEEVDVITKGGNYGWRTREGFHEFRAVPTPEISPAIDPIIEYAHNNNLAAQSKFPDHGIGTSITGGYVYRGKKYPSLRGVYIYADYTLGTIWGLRYENGAMTEHGTLLSQPKNISSFAEDQDGEIYITAFDGSDGKIFHLTTASGN